MRKKVEVINERVKELYNSGFMDDFMLSSLIAQANGLAHRATIQVFKNLNITPTQAALLIFILILGDKATPSNLARHMIRSRASMATLLNRIENRGYIVQVDNPLRKKSKCIKLTDSGNKICDKALGKFKDRVYTGLSKIESDNIISNTLVIRNGYAQALGINPNKIPFPPKEYIDKYSNKS